MWAHFQSVWPLRLAVSLARGVLAVGEVLQGLIASGIVGGFERGGAAALCDVLVHQHRTCLQSELLDQFLIGAIAPASQ